MTGQMTNLDMLAKLRRLLGAPLDRLDGFGLDVELVDAVSAVVDARARSRTEADQLRAELNRAQDRIATLKASNGRAADLDRQLRQSRDYEAAALRLAADAGITGENIEAEVEHNRAQLARLNAERDRLDADRGAVLNLAWRMANATKDVSFTPAQIARMLHDLLDGKRRIRASVLSDERVPEPPAESLSQAKAPDQPDLFSTV